MLKLFRRIFEKFRQNATKLMRLHTFWSDAFLSQFHDAWQLYSGKAAFAERQWATFLFERIQECRVSSRSWINFQKVNRLRCNEWTISYFWNIYDQATARNWPECIYDICFARFLFCTGSSWNVQSTKVKPTDHLKSLRNFKARTSILPAFHSFSSVERTLRANFEVIQITGT